MDCELEIVGLDTSVVHFKLRQRLCYFFIPTTVIIVQAVLNTAQVV